MNNDMFVTKMINKSRKFSYDIPGGGRVSFYWPDGRI